MNKTLKNITFYIGAVVISKFIGAFRSFGVAKILNPSDYGIWITMLLIVSYAPIFCLGTVEALVKQVPFYAGEGRATKSRQIDSAVFGSIILSFIFLLIIGFGVNFWCDIKQTGLSSYEIYLMIFVGGATLFYGYFYNRLIAYQHFQHVSLIDTVHTGIGFILIVGFAFFMGIKGAVIGLLISEFSTSIFAMFIANHKCGRISPYINFKLLAKLIKIGLPITFIWWIFMIQSSADRIISMSMLGSTATGYYGVGIAFISLVTLIPDAIGRVLYPKVNETLGQNASREDLIKIVLVPAQLIGIIMSFALAIIISILPWGYRNFLPEYLPGLQSAEFLLIGSFFFCLIRIGVNLLIASNLQNKLLKYFTICLLFNVLGNIALVKLGWGILGLAISTSASQALLASLTWTAVIKKLYDVKNIFNSILSLYLPFFILMFVWALSHFIGSIIGTPSALHEFIYIVCFNIIFAAIMLTTPTINRQLRDQLFPALKNNFRFSR